MYRILLLYSIIPEHMLLDIAIKKCLWYLITHIYVDGCVVCVLVL